MIRVNILIVFMTSCMFFAGQSKGSISSLSLPGSHHTHPEICWASGEGSMLGQALQSEAFWLQVFSVLFQVTFPLGRNTQMHVLRPGQSCWESHFIRGQTVPP